jgi:hydrogenase nickel incorporation protein HypB
MSRIAELRQNVLKKNDLLAAELRNRFARADLTVINLVSSPGSGKTSLLESTLRQLQPRHAVAALVGDLATDNDARRLSLAASQVKQITTGTVCHLDAAMIEAAINGWQLDGLDFLFIENVGNLVCPASYDIGETMRVVLLSVTEGEDKPLKYPTIFNSADLAVITKIDLAEAAGFDREQAHANVHEVAPALPICEVSSRSGAGMRHWLDQLQDLRVAARTLPGPARL